MTNKELMNEIIRLKEEKGYKILGHNYLIGDILDISDETGDSLALARKAMDMDADKIMFIGVDFMAETLKILNPEKRIFVPTRASECTMANSLDRETLIKFKEKYPNASVVLYVNSTAECKMEADCVCTSANAVEIVNNIENDTILFGPDKNLASYVAEKTGKTIIPVPGDDGFCYVHDEFKKEEVLVAKEKYPNAKLITHPESPKEVRDLSEYIGGTGKMLKIPLTDDTKDYIIGTEAGMIHQLKKNHPDRNFYPLKNSAICIGMKKNTLKNLYEALKEDKHEIILSDEIMKKAVYSIENMFKVMG